MNSTIEPAAKTDTFTPTAPEQPPMVALAADGGLVFRVPAHWDARLRGDGICESVAEILPGEVACDPAGEMKKKQEALGIFVS